MGDFNDEDLEGEDPETANFILKERLQRERQNVISLEEINAEVEQENDVLRAVADAADAYYRTAAMFGDSTLNAALEALDAFYDKQEAKEGS